jgi:hypothetical protein
MNWVVLRGSEVAESLRSLGTTQLAVSQERESTVLEPYIYLPPET